MADRFNADAKYIDDLVRKQIPKVNMLNISGERNKQTVIYLLAMALGVQEGKRTPSVKKEALILEGSFRNQDLAMAYVYSVAIQELRKLGRENEINDTDIVYKIAEEYANTGFKKIEEMVPDFKDYDEDIFELSLIEMMDEVYDKISKE